MVLTSVNRFDSYLHNIINIIMIKINDRLIMIRRFKSAVKPVENVVIFFERAT